MTLHSSGTSLGGPWAAGLCALSGALTHPPMAEPTRSGGPSVLYNKG